MFRNTLPAIIGLGTLQLNTLADTLIAMWPVWIGQRIAGFSYPLDTAANSILFYAQRLYQFPLGVFGIAVATVIFPRLAQHAKEPSQFSQTLRQGIALSLFIGLPASVGLAFAGPDLVATLFGSSTTIAAAASEIASPPLNARVAETVHDAAAAFSADGLSRASLVLLGYAAAVWAYGINQVLTRGLYALGDTRSPMRIAIATVALNITLNAFLIWTPLREAGLAWSTAACAIVQSMALSASLRRTKQTPILDAQTRRSIGATLARTAAMATGLIAAVVLLSPAITWSASASRLAVIVAAGAGIYLAASLLTKAPELRSLLR